MDMLEQIQIWRENGESQKIIDALEAISADERTPEMDLALGREYIIGVDLYKKAYSEQLKKAITVMKPHEQYFESDYEWNFWIGFAYFFLDQCGPALRYIHNAKELEPDDEKTEHFIDACKTGISRPYFMHSFRERTQLAWERFAEKEALFRQMLDEDAQKGTAGECEAQVLEILEQAIENIEFALFAFKEKYELVLIPDANKVRLFEMVYLQKHAPQKVLRHWNIRVGLQPGYITDHVTSDGVAINWDDVQIWLEEKSEKTFSLYAYCEKLSPLFQENPWHVRSLLRYYTYNALGEISFMRDVDSFEVLEKPRTDPAILLSNLHQHLKKRGFTLSTDPQAYLERLTDYEGEQNEDPDAYWRLDVMTGSSSCMPLIESYMSMDDRLMDRLHANGITAGFFCYSLKTQPKKEHQKSRHTAGKTLKGKDKLISQLHQYQEILDFRQALENEFATDDGEDILTFTGNAIGFNHGYVDFIAWDIHAVLEKAQAFFERSHISNAYFHTFYATAYAVPQNKLFEKDPDDDKEAKATDTTHDTIFYTPDNADAFFAQLKQWNDENRYSWCIKAIEAIPKEQWDYRIAISLAAALQNYAIIGENHQPTPALEKYMAIMRAIMVLQSVGKEGLHKAEWNMRMAFAYQSLQKKEEKAIPYALRWAALDPDGEIAPPDIFLYWMQSQSASENIRIRKQGNPNVKPKKKKGS